ncbi:hypothetical protein EK599_08380 [Vibrio sp. T187]|uniref:outer membrane protein n=1 Tax=Vibrio TaxID=662 RepID=UPI0010C9BC51|nr:MULTISPECIES: outer membrane beta-barrel protein [Vibrio]MBW3695710.1 hypothetical protein [Vibrio sp. T187]
MKSNSLLPLLSALALSCSFNASAKSNQYEFAYDLGVSQVDNGEVSKSGFTSRAKFNYYFSHFFGLEFSYTDMVTSPNDFVDSVEDTNTSVSYTALSAGGIARQPLNKLITLYASGGISNVKLSESIYDNATFSKTENEETSIKPYINAGVSMTSPWSNVTFSLDYTYQDLGLDYTASYISIGGHYNF